MQETFVGRLRGACAVLPGSHVLVAVSGGAKGVSVQLRTEDLARIRRRCFVFSAKFGKHTRFPSPAHMWSTAFAARPRRRTCAL